MDVVWLARVQFALTVMFHFLFPPISIGLAFLLAGLETARWRTGRDLYRRLSDFWLKILAINFVVGVASGIVMEFQFGTNWASYSRFVGDIFGAPLAAEGVFAFFLESGFIGLLIFGRKRISSTTRWLASALVALGTALSAFWILVANSWMQTPAGYRLVEGRAELVSFAEAVFNPSTLPRFAHTMASSFACGAFLMTGVAAWHLLKGRDDDAIRSTLRVGAVAAFVTTVLVVFTGDRHAKQVARTQEAKFAAMEGLYSTTHGAPMILFSLPPTQDGMREGPELAVTRLTSFLAFGNFRAPVKGLSEFPREDWPPVAVTFLTFHNMVVVGNLMGLLGLVGTVLVWRGAAERTRWWLRAMLWGAPLPMIAIQLGWAAAEVGRQPWIVAGVLRTRDAVSRVVSAPELVFSIGLFSVVYLLLGGLWVYLMREQLVRGPERAAPSPEPSVRRAPAPEPALQEATHA